MMINFIPDSDFDPPDSLFGIPAHVHRTISGFAETRRPGQSNAGDRPVAPTRMEGGRMVGFPPRLPMGGFGTRPYKWKMNY